MYASAYTKWDHCNYYKITMSLVSSEIDKYKNKSTFGQRFYSADYKAINWGYNCCIWRNILVLKDR